MPGWNAMTMLRPDENRDVRVAADETPITSRQFTQEMPADGQLALRENPLVS